MAGGDSTVTDRINGVMTSVAVKAPVAVASSGSLTLSGAQTVNGVAVAETDPPTRVLVKDQADATKNGIYDVFEGAWLRSVDFDGAYDAVQGSQVLSYSGARTYYLTTANPVVFETSAITFATFADPAILTPQIYGAVGDGVANDTAALLLWLAAIGSGYYANTITGAREGFLPAGKYKCTQRLTPATTSKIRGVPYCSVIQPTSAVTTIAFEVVAGCTYDGLTIDGVNAAAGVIGMGSDNSVNTPINSVVIDNCVVVRFSGVNSCGLRVLGAEHWTINDSDFDANYDNIHIGNDSVPDSSAVVTFNNCLSNSAVRRNLWAESGQELNFHTFETNSAGQENIYLYEPSGSGRLNRVLFYNPHIEEGWISLAGNPARNAQFQLLGHSVRGLILRDPVFEPIANASGAAKARAITLISCPCYVIDNPRVSTSNPEISFSGTSFGALINWPSDNGAIGTSVVNTSSDPLNPYTFGANADYQFVQTRGVAVADLPAAATYPGLRAFVTNSNAAMTAGIGAIVAGGGANLVPIFSDGTNWRIG